MSHPEVPSCKDCAKWMYNPETWEQVKKLQVNADGLLERLPLARPPGSPTPCAACPKSGPKDGWPRPDKELNARNFAAFWFHNECAAVGQWPNDRIVRRNAGIIRWVEEEIARAQAQLTPSLLMRALFKRR